MLNIRGMSTLETFLTGVNRFGHGLNVRVQRPSETTPSPAPADAAVLDYPELVLEQVIAKCASKPCRNLESGWRVLRRQTKDDEARKLSGWIGADIGETNIQRQENSPFAAADIADAAIRWPPRP